MHTHKKDYEFKDLFQFPYQEAYLNNIFAVVTKHI